MYTEEIKQRRLLSKTARPKLAATTGALASAGSSLTVLAMHSLVIFYALYFLTNDYGALSNGSGNFVVRAIIRVLFGISVALLAAAVVSAYRAGKGRLLSQVDRGLIYFLLLVGLLAFFRGLFTTENVIASDQNPLLTLFVNPDVGGLIWFIPFVAIAGANRATLELLRSLFFFYTVIGTAIAAYFIAAHFILHKPVDMYDYLFTKVILFGLYPLVMLPSKGKIREQIVGLTGLALFMALQLLTYRRQDLAMSTVCLFYFLVLRHPRTTASFFLTLLIWSAATVVLTIIAVSSLTYYNVIEAQWVADDRSFIYTEFMATFSLIDWLIGRGALGTYYSQYFAYLILKGIPGGDFYYRQNIESAYLHYVLKTGLIGLVPFVIISVRAAFNAFFRHGHSTSRAVGMLICMRLVGSFVGNQSMFAPDTVLFWLLIGYALSKDVAMSPSRISETRVLRTISQGGSAPSLRAAKSPS